MYNLFIFFCYSNIDEYGFKRPDDFDYETHERIMSKYFVVLTNRRRKWDHLMRKRPNLYNNKSRQLKRYIRKGIPGSNSIYISFY